MDANGNSSHEHRGSSEQAAWLSQKPDDAYSPLPSGNYGDGIDMVSHTSRTALGSTSNSSSGTNQWQWSSSGGDWKDKLLAISGRVKASGTALGKKLGEGVAVVTERVGEGVAVAGERVSEGFVTAGELLVDVLTPLTEADVMVERATATHLLEPQWPIVALVSQRLAAGYIPSSEAAMAVRRRLTLRPADAHVQLLALAVLQALARSFPPLLGDVIREGVLQEMMRLAQDRRSAERVKQTVAAMLQGWVEGEGEGERRRGGRFVEFEEAVELLVSLGLHAPISPSSSSLAPPLPIINYPTLPSVPSSLPPPPRFHHPSPSPSHPHPPSPRTAAIGGGAPGTVVSGRRGAATDLPPPLPHLESEPRARSVHFSDTVDVAFLSPTSPAPAPAPNVDEDGDSGSDSDSDGAHGDSGSVVGHAGGGGGGGEQGGEGESRGNGDSGRTRGSGSRRVRGGEGSRSKRGMKGRQAGSVVAMALANGDMPAAVTAAQTAAEVLQSMIDAAAGGEGEEGGKRSDGINTLAAECRLAQRELRRAIEVDGRVSEEKLLNDTLAAMDKVSEALMKLESLRLKEGEGNDASDG